MFNTDKWKYHTPDITLGDSAIDITDDNSISLTPDKHRTATFSCTLILSGHTKHNFIAAWFQIVLG